MVNPHRKVENLGRLGCLVYEIGVRPGCPRIPLAA